MEELIFNQDEIVRLRAENERLKAKIKKMEDNNIAILRSLLLQEEKPGTE